MNEHCPKFSLVIPSYNQGSFIEETILSVLNQNYPNLELIIIDGGSTDNTIEIIKKYSDKITFWKSEKDSGQSNAINKGIEKATGEIFNWLNSDDTLTPDSLFQIAELYNKYQFDVLCGKSKHFDNESDEEVNIGQTYFHSEIEKTIAHYSMSQPSTFYKLEIVKKLGGVNESLHFAMDAELWFKYLFYSGNTYKVAKTEKSLANFRIHNNSKTIAQKALFITDTNTLFYSILNSINAPEYISEPYKEPRNEEYKDNWEFSAINKKRLFGYFAQKNTTYYYTLNKYKAAKKNNWYVITKFNINAHILSYFIKLFLIPRFILNFVRKIK